MTLITAPSTNKSAIAKLEEHGLHDLPGLLAFHSFLEGLTISERMDILRKWLEEYCPGAVTLRIRLDSDGDAELDFCVLGADGTLVPSIDELMNEMASYVLDVDGELFLPLAKEVTGAATASVRGRVFDASADAVLAHAKELSPAN